MQSKIDHLRRLVNDAKQREKELIKRQEQVHLRELAAIQREKDQVLHIKFLIKRQRKAEEKNKKALKRARWQATLANSGFF